MASTFSYLIIEDEPAPQKRLKKLVSELEPESKLVATLTSVEESVEWLANNSEPDLIFMDIQLADGISFEIFNEISIEKPVIFVTAYDQYALQAFKLNSIDYLLKPLEKKDLERSLNKFHKLQATSTNSFDVSTLLKQLNINNLNYKSRFLIKFKQSFIVVSVADISYFSVDNQLVMIHTFDKKRYTIEHSLDELETMLNPQDFFKINRQYILNFRAIKAIHNHFNGRLKLDVSPIFSEEEEIFVSREKTNDFKKWLDR